LTGDAPPPILSPITPGSAPTMDHDHKNHPHQHGPGCGHPAVVHGDHVDYLHNGHLHHVDGAKVEEHALDITPKNPSDCEAPSLHHPPHTHGPACGHEAVPHGDHTDYVVNGRLHHPHDGHCDDHGPVVVLKNMAP